MAHNWTSQRVFDMAPDASSMTAGRGQARASKWPLLGRSEVALWGEVQGSGKKPYQVRIDLREPAFSCSCPSRKLPCKHALGLLLMLAEQPGEIAESAPPEWVSEWLVARDERATKQKSRAEAAAQKKVDPEAQARRAAKREAKVTAGVEQLGVWLGDLVRRGLAWAQTQPNSYWDNAAARLVDAQAPGLARLVRELGATVSTGEGWQSQFVRRLGHLHLAVQGYRRLDTLPGLTQADLRGLVGWTRSREELHALPAEVGTWCVAGLVVEQEENLTVQRAWIVRVSDGRPGVVLDFAAPGQAVESLIAPGSGFPAEVVYYPGASPIRAMIASRKDNVGLSEWPGLATIDAAFEGYAAALAANPWIVDWPLTLDNVRVIPPAIGGGWSLRDRTNAEIPLALCRDEMWPLISVAGGASVKVFGEWNGELLTVLGVWADGAYYSGSQSQQGPPLTRVA